MHRFHYSGPDLFCESVDLAAVARLYGTPTYVYSATTISDHCRRLQGSFAGLDVQICYAVKANSNLALLRLFSQLGVGFDLVSAGEIRRVIAAGGEVKASVFAGVGKTEAEIALALENGVYAFHVESEPELARINHVAGTLGVKAPVAIRINPDVDPKTHRYTSTGKKETKFGVDLERARRFFATYGRDPHARLEGLHLHIGSPIYTVDPYREAMTKTAALVDELARDGFEIHSIDLGGGFGADYESAQSPPLKDYADAIVPLAKPLYDRGVRFILEPGRTIVANAGILVLSVLYTKTSGDKRFVICDAGMNALLRPSHYGSFHFMWPVAPGVDMTPARRTLDPKLPDTMAQDVVGPLCETGDFLALDRVLPASIGRGDLLAVFTAGAYGMSMASRYNSSPLPAEVLVSGTSAEIVRRRETFDTLVEHELKPIALELPAHEAPKLEAAR